MNGNSGAGAGRAVTPQIAEAHLHASFDRSFNPLKGLKKVFFRVVNKIVPRVILKFLAPVDTEKIRKGLRDRGICVKDGQQVRRIADVMQSRICIGMKDIMKILGSNYTPLPAPANRCQIAGIPCVCELSGNGNGRHHDSVFRAQATEDQPPAAIVNAGALDGHIGGGGLNRIFASVAPFVGLPLRRTRFKQDLNKRLAAQSPGNSHIRVYDLSTQDLGMKSVTLYKAADKHVGSVAVYEYAEPPYGNAANQAMVYVFPPRRGDYKTDDDFLAAVEQTASNMIAAYNHYANQKRRDGETVPELHVHAFSSGLYSGSVPAAMVTKAILRGVYAKCQELDQEGTLSIPKMQFSAPFEPVLSRLSADARYLDRPRPVTIDQSLSEDDKRFLLFFNGDGRINGYTRQSISDCSFSRLERGHGYIQAVFPDRKQGTARAPLLSPALIDVLKAPENKIAVKKYIEDMLVHTMLPFWGIRYESTDSVTGELNFSQGRFSIDDVERSNGWRTKNADHSHRHITRVLHFLVATGYQNYARRLCQFMQEKRQEMRLPPVVQWVSALPPPIVPVRPDR